MKDLQSLITHPNMRGGSTLVLCSGKPITLFVGDDKKPMGQPLNNQKLHGLLKASLPPDVLENFQWGRAINHKLEVAGKHYKMRIILKPEKTFLVELDLNPAEPTPAPKPAPAAAPPKAEPAPIAAPQMDAPAEKDYTMPAPPPTISAPDDDPGFMDEVSAMTDAEQTALIYVPGGGDTSALEAGLSSLGYPVRKTVRADVAMEVIKYHHYPVFIMCLGSDYRQDPIYRNLAVMNMEARRTQYAILTAPGLQTGNTLLAFSLSVNLVIGADDQGELAEVAEKGIKDWKRFVKPLHEFLQEVGRLN